jgi:hypothetical protein
VGRERGDFMEEWKAKIASQYAAAVERGEHDDRCEHDSGGFYLCHCSKRRREAEGFTEPPTENLFFPPPDCPRCDEVLTHDGDGWVCGECSLSWDSDGDGRSISFTDDFGDDLAGDAARWRAKQPEASNA